MTETTDEHRLDQEDEPEFRCYAYEPEDFDAST
jgi:hypothetical protein